MSENLVALSENVYDKINDISGNINEQISNIITDIFDLSGNIINNIFDLSGNINNKINDVSGNINDLSQNLIDLSEDRGRIQHRHDACPSDSDPPKKKPHVASCPFFKNILKHFKHCPD